MFDIAVAALFVHPAFPGREGGFGLPSGFWNYRGPSDQVNQPIDRVLTVSILGTETPGLDNQYAFSGNPPSRETN